MRTNTVKFTSRPAGAERGLALLESTLILIVLLTLLTGAVGFVQYLSQSTVVNQAVDKHVYDSGIKPFRFSIDAGGQVYPEFLESEVRSTVEAMRDGALQQLLASVQPESQTASSIRVEAAYATVAIDVHTGRADVSSLVITPVGSAGDYAIPAELDAELNLRAEFLSRAEEEKEEGVSFAAIPRGQVRADATAARYLPLGVLVGARAAVTLEGSGTARLLNVVGVEPILGSRKVVWLRGDIGR